MEFAIALPFIFVLMCGVYDVGSMLGTYLQLSEIVHQGVRMATRMNTLPAGDYSGLSTGQTCSPLGASAEHALVQQRISGFIAMSQNRLNLAGVCIRSGRTFIATGSNAPVHNTIYVRLEGTYSALFPLFDGFPINVEARGPYLL